MKPIIWRKIAKQGNPSRSRDLLRNNVNVITFRFE